MQNSCQSSKNSTAHSFELSGHSQSGAVGRPAVAILPHAIDKVLKRLQSRHVKAAAEVYRDVGFTAERGPRKA